MLDYFKGWVAGKSSLNHVSSLQLRERRLLLDNEARQWQFKLDMLHTEKLRMIEAYAEAKYLNKTEHLRFIARQFEELKDQIDYTESTHVRIIKHMRLLLGLERLKENESLLNATSQSAVFNLDMTELQGYIETTSARNELDQSKLDNLLYTLEDVNSRARIGIDASTNAAICELEDLVEFRDSLLPNHADTDEIENEINQIEATLEISQHEKSESINSTNSIMTNQI